MRRTIAVLALTVLVVTAGCSALAGSSGSGANANDAQDQNDASGAGAADRTVEVAASGQIQAVPDRAIVRVAVPARADSVEAVRRQLAANASRMREALEESGLDAEQITSARFDIGRNYRHEDDPREPAFQGQHAFVITLNDTDRAGEVVVTAVENGATEIDEVRFTLAPGTRQQLRSEAIAAAVANAGDQAAVAANGTGLALAGVHTVRTADVSADPIRHREVAFAGVGGDGGGVPTSFRSGRVTVSAQVLVVYNATDA